MSYQIKVKSTGEIKYPYDFSAMEDGFVTVCDYKGLHIYENKKDGVFTSEAHEFCNFFTNIEDVKRDIEWFFLWASCKAYFEGVGINAHWVLC